MIRKFFFPLIAFFGIAFGAFMVYMSSKKPRVADILFTPPTSPYQHYLAADGMVEPIYKPTIIGTSFDELVTDVYVHVGDIVKKGTPLFKQDTSSFKAQLVQALQEEAVAQTDYHNQSVQFSFYQKLVDKAAVSKQAFQAAAYSKELAKKRLMAAKAAVNIIKINITRSTVYAPIDGEILQVNIHAGESLNRVGQTIGGSGSSQAPIIFGDTKFYHVRIDIDEEDAWRFISGAQATAFVRGNASLRIPLEFCYLEPHMVPKKSLSGLGAERVDTRVLQVVYKFTKQQFPVFVGQQLDVYLEAKAHRDNQ